MTPHTAALFFGISALLALIPMLVAVVRAHRAHDWTLTTTLVLGVGLAGTLPTVASNLGAGQRPLVTDAFGNLRVGLSAGAYRVDQAVNAALLVGSIAFLVLRCVTGRARLNVAPLIAVVLCLEMAASNGLNGHQLLASRQVVLLVVLLAAAVADPGRPALLGAGMTGLLVLVLSGVQALLVGPGAFRDCRSDKCGVFGVLYTGVFTNENLFGLLLALSVPFIWLGLRGRVGKLLAVYTALVAVATGSRQSIAAAVVALALLVALRPKLPDQPDRRPPVEQRLPAEETRAGVGRALIGTIAVVGAALIGMVIPFLPLGSGALSGRAYYWQVAREQLRGSPLYGFGANAWSDLYQIGQIPVALTYSTHNQWLNVLYAGGLIGLGILLVLLGYLLVRGGLPGLPLAACVLTPVLVGSCLERPWSFGVNDWLSFTLVATVLLPVTARPSAPPIPSPPNGVLGSHALGGKADRRPEPLDSAPAARVPAADAVPTGPASRRATSGPVAGPVARRHARSPAPRGRTDR